MAQVIYVPGAEPPVNDGERRVIGYLQLHLPDEYALYPGVQIIHQGRADDVDVLILTPHALVVGEVKDIAGHLAIDNNACYVDDNLRPQPFNVTNAKARRLKSRLQDWDPRLRDLWVSPLVILAREPASLHLVPKSLHEDFMVVEEAVTKLTDPSRILPGPPYTELGDLRDATKEALNLTRGRETDVSFGAYRCTKLLDRTPEEDLWAATHSVTGEEVEIRHVGRNPMTRAARIAEAQGEVETFGRLRDRPWIDGPREMIPQDDGTLALVFSERSGITLADALAAGEEVKSEQVILDLVSAIDAAHSIGAVHGRLSPRWIEIQPDLARIRGFTSKGGVIPTKLIEDDRQFLAPEAVGREKPVGAPADIFSLGRIIELLDPDHHSLQALGEELANPDVSRRKVPAGYIRRALASLFGVTAGDETTTTRIELDESGRVEAGSVIGSYVVADFLGSGGFSHVYSARHALGGPMRALKMFQGEESRDMVAHEFNVLQGLEDPHVVEVIGAGEWDEGWFMVSEYLEGETLTQRIDAFDGEADVGEATLIGFELLDALVSIHEKGVTHRDVKPDNVILVEGRGAVLFDFGVAASREEQVAGLTWQYWPPGLPAGSTSPDSDLFATGIMLCELVTGEHPYPNRNPHAGDAPDLSRVPPALREVIARAIDPNHEDRFASASEFREQLEPFVDQRREVTVSRRDRYRRVERLISMGQLDEAEALCLPEWKRLVARIDRKRQAETASDTDFFRGLRVRFAGTDTERVYRLDNSGPVDARTWLYQVTGKPGLMLDVRIAEDDEGERQIATVDAFDSPEKFKQLENRLRHGIREEGDYYVMRLRYTKRPEEGRPTQRQTTLEELSEDAGVDVREALIEAGAIDVGRREELGLHEPLRSRNEVAVLIPEGIRNDVALRAYLLTTVIPLAREADLLLQDS